VQFFARKEQKDPEKAASSDDEEDWPLLPFHRWARTRQRPGWNNWEEGSEEQNEVEEQIIVPKA
jgi:hypothetical protein